MNHKLMLCLFLLSTYATHAMDTLSKDIIIYNLAPNLDRDDRTALKLITKPFYEFITPQHILNEEYKAACIQKDTVEAIKLRSKGALTIKEEIYRLSFKDKQKLIKKIILSDQDNMSDILLYGVEQNDAPFMKWLIDTKKPHYASQLFQDILEYSQQLSNDTYFELESYQRLQARAYRAENQAKMNSIAERYASKYEADMARNAQPLFPIHEGIVRGEDRFYTVTNNTQPIFVTPQVTLTPNIQPNNRIYRQIESIKNKCKPQDPTCIIS